jgi:hypothetical protein
VPSVSGPVDSTKGTTYVVAGGGGQASVETFIQNSRTRVFTAAGQVAEAAPWSLPSRSGEHSLLCVDVTPATHAGQPTTMRVRSISATNVILDDVTLSRPAVVGTAAPTSKTSDLPTLGLGAGAVVAAAGTGLLVVRRRAASRSEL